jgi:hypothetical protein
VVFRQGSLDERNDLVVLRRGLSQSDVNLFQKKIGVTLGRL